MVQQTRIFNTSGPIDTKLHYNVPRTDAVTDLVRRIKDGRYVVIFAPRQTGKTTLFQDALEMIANEEANYYPLQLDFQTFRNVSAEEFYQLLKTDIRDEVERRCQKQDRSIKPELRQFLEEYSLTSHISLRPFLGKLAKHLDNRRIAIIIDEFDGIPQSCLADFLYPNLS